MTTTLRSEDGRVIVPERLRRRRVQVRRDRGRRRLRRVIAFGVVVVVLAAGWAVVRSPLMAVRHVDVSGSSHVDAAQVASAAGIHRGDAMMDVSPSQIRRRLTALPWVARASVSRQWPDRVRIHLVDRTPVAQIASGGSFALVDGTGRVLQTGRTRTPGLPVLAGVRASEPGTRVASVGPLLKAAAALPEAYEAQVGDITLGRDGAVALTMKSDGVVTLGNTDGITAKFASAGAVLKHLGGLGKGCTLDVSVPLSPTLTPEYGCV